ncbi:hypothetical protein Tco_0292217 [Tanacetum coccineum]
MFWHTAQDGTLFTAMRCISRHEDTQVYGIILPKDLTNQEMLESKAYKIYYAFTSGEKTPKPKYIRKKIDFDTSPKQNPVQATKGTRIKTKAKVSKSDKKKQPAKMPKAKGLDVLSKSKVPDEQHLKTTGTDDETGTILGVPDVPIYESESKKESWGDSGEEDKDDENDSDHKSDGNNDDDANDEDNQEGDDTNDDDKETDSDRTESDIIKIPVLNQSITEYYEEEEEKINDEETMDEEEDNEVTKELYDDVNVNLGNEDTDMTNTNQGASERQNVSQELGFEQVKEDAHVTLTPILHTQKADEPIQSSSVSSNFTSKLLNLENPSPADYEIASLMETLAHHAMVVPEYTSGFITTIPPPPSFFNTLPQQATPTPTPATSEATTLLTSLLDFSSRFKLNERVTKLGEAINKAIQSLSSIPVIVDHYINNKHKEAINKAIQAHNLDYFANPVIEKNITESLEAAVLTRSSSQPKFTYEAAVKRDDPNITMEEYIRLEEEKARRHDKVYNWETATYGKIWDNEDVHDLGYVETKFPSIVFNNTLTSETAFSCEPMVSSLNNDEIDFRISFDESEDEDCMPTIC